MPARSIAGPRADRPDISASELADHVFCARSWWLKRVGGVKPVSLALVSGLVAHKALGVKVQTAVSAEGVVHGLRWALVVLAIFLGLLVLGGLFGCAAAGPEWYGPSHSLSRGYYNEGPRPLLDQQVFQDYRDAVGYYRWLDERTTVYGWGARGYR